MDLRELANKADALSRPAAPARGNFTKDKDGAAHPSGIFLFRRERTTAFDAVVYNPLICLILQGAKETLAGGRQATLNVGDAVLVSHHLPILSRITRATPKRPYLSMIVRLDLETLRTLDADVPGDESVERNALEVAPVDDHVARVLDRYLDAAVDPRDARVLGPLIQRELHYRLLTSPMGAMLRALVRRDSHASRISKALTRLRADYQNSLEVSELARSVGMSTSSFHKHFKLVTRTTPLRYQKDLRLTEARRLLRGGAHSVSTAAFEVGYESPSQFSREYARKFGAPPRTDLEATV